MVCSVWDGGVSVARMRLKARDRKREEGIRARPEPAGPAARDAKTASRTSTRNAIDANEER